MGRSRGPSSFETRPTGAPQDEEERLRSPDEAKRNPGMAAPRIALRSMRATRLRDELAHDRIQRVLALEADAGALREREIAIVEHRVVGEAAEGGEHTRIGLRPAKTEAGRDGERHLVAAVREQRLSAPPV